MTPNGTRERPGSSASPVAVAIVTHDSAADLPACLDAVALLRPGPLEVVVVDCASRDGSAEAARRWGDARRPGFALEVVPLAENRGFAGGMNAALEESRAPWVLSLNADARPGPEYLGRLLERAFAHPELRVAAVTGRLVRPSEAGGRRRIDACGMRLTSTWRHLDRGSGEADRGQWSAPERVFGATGAASLFRREALLDAAVDGEVFDSRFHSFREDAELAFRLRERGWEVLYEPRAHCEHRRFNLPERRREMPALINYHSLKNRYLLRFYHQTGGNLLLTLVPTLGRDVLAFAWVTLAERSSFAVYRWLWSNRRRILARRRLIQSRRRVSSWAVDRWFFTRGLPLANDPLPTAPPRGARA